MRYRIPGRPNGRSGNVGGFADDYAKDPFGALYDKIPEENKQKSREDADTLSDYAKDPAGTLYEENTGGGEKSGRRRTELDLDSRGGIQFSPSSEEGKDEETSPLVWVAGLGAAGLLAYLLLKK